MKTSPITPEDLTGSVIAVPPLARHADPGAARAANLTLIRHLETAGVTSLMYGGNANFYNLPISEYASTLSMLTGLAGADSWIIPAVGPDFGRITDQAPVVRDHGFPTAMALPPTGALTEDGVMCAMRHLSDAIRAPVLLYIRQEAVLSPASVARLVDDGVAGWIKYAIVRSDPARDAYLDALTKVVDPWRIISGIGERPVVAHFTHHGLSSFTSGSVSVAPGLSDAIRRALGRGDEGEAARLRELFIPLEDCRDAMGPARVIHDAVTLAGVADMGRLMPLLSNLDETEREKVAPAARTLLEQERGRGAS